MFNNLTLKDYEKIAKIRSILNKITAENFFDVYKEFLPEYSAIITHLISGPIIALELRQDDVVNKLRALVLA